MFRSITSRITPSSVIATIALFVALGGGYAVAFKGSGTVQKGALLNIPAEFTTVRSLTGIGSIQAACLDSNPDVPSIYFRNTSGETLNAFGTGLDGDVELVNVDSGQTVTIRFGVVDRDSINLHISPVDGGKRPQADVQISAHDTNDCTTSYVTVLVTNTQE